MSQFKRQFFPHKHFYVEQAHLCLTLSMTLLQGKVMNQRGSFLSVPIAPMSSHQWAALNKFIQIFSCVIENEDDHC